jgi:hypothetical protein
MAASHLHTRAWTQSSAMQAHSQAAVRCRLRPVLTGPQRCAPRRAAVRVCASGEPPKARLAPPLPAVRRLCRPRPLPLLAPDTLTVTPLSSSLHVATAQGHAEQLGRGAWQARAGTALPGVVLPCSIDAFTLLVVAASFLESLPVSSPTASSGHVCAPPDTGCGGASDAGGADTQAGEPEQRAGERVAVCGGGGETATRFVRRLCV